MNDPTFDQVTRGGLVAAAVGAGAGSALGLAAPGFGAAAGAGIEALINFTGSAIDRRRHRAAEALEAASAQAEVGPDELLSIVLEDEVRTELALRALTAASQSTLEAKVRALGRALATGALASDDAIVDQESFVVNALAQLEAPHVKVLSIMERQPIAQENGVMYKSGDLAWTVTKLDSRYPQAKALSSSIVATLSGIGSISQLTIGVSDYQEPVYQLSAFGQELLKRLREAGLER